MFSVDPKHVDDDDDGVNVNDDDFLKIWLTEIRSLNVRCEGHPTLERRGNYPVITLWVTSPIYVITQIKSRLRDPYNH